MENLINLKDYPVNGVLKTLLADKTTKQNIVFATSAVSHNNALIDARTQMTPAFLQILNPEVIQPRVAKDRAEQTARTRSNAEVFTPSWVCNKMNNVLDEEWFGRPGVFNSEQGQTWTVNPVPVQFAKPKDWQKYVDSRRLEITCGEAPFIVSRYDTATGQMIEIQNRIGLLDRKMRVVCENAQNETDWKKWALRAVQSVYGYEIQGDSLLIARINILMTYVDYAQKIWGKAPKDAELRKVANVIAWNFWQMDGLAQTTPAALPRTNEKQRQLFAPPPKTTKRAAKKPKAAKALFELAGESQIAGCRVYDWRKNCSLNYTDIQGSKK